MLPVDLQRLALTESIVSSTSARLAAVLARQTLHPRSEPPRPAGSAFVVEGRSEPSGMFLRVVVSAAGTVAAMLTESLRRPAFHTGQIADIRLASLLNLVFGTLTDLGASGRGLCHLTMRVKPTASGAGHVVTLGSANQGYAMGTAKPFELDEEMLLPITDESVAETAERMMRALAREAGIHYWERNPPQTV